MPLLEISSKDLWKFVETRADLQQIQAILRRLRLTKYEPEVSELLARFNALISQMAADGVKFK